MWAKGRVKLASEPKGKRFGLFDAKGRVVDIKAPIGPDWKGANGVKPILAVMVGDSLVAGCGVGDQSKGIMPLLAARVASVPVGRWPGVRSASSARPLDVCAIGARMGRRPRAGAGRGQEQGRQGDAVQLRAAASQPGPAARCAATSNAASARRPP